jgi:hypothetical protein
MYLCTKQNNLVEPSYSNQTWHCNPLCLKFNSLRHLFSCVPIASHILYIGGYPSQTWALHPLCRKFESPDPWFSCVLLYPTFYIYRKYYVVPLDNKESIVQLASKHAALWWLQVRLHHITLGEENIFHMFPLL